MFFKLVREDKVHKQIFRKKSFLKKFTHFEITSYLGFFDFFENPDLGHVQIAIKQ